MDLPHSNAVFNILRLLTPREVTSHAKCRIGGRADGGYVMFDDFALQAPVYSFGIGGNVEFDEDLANRGHQVYMFDHTVAGLPKSNDNFFFSRRGISSFEGEAKDCFTLPYLMAEYGHSARNDMILKMDIEGPEWDILSIISPETLGKFRQIVLEVHGLLQLDRAQFRTKIQGSLESLNAKFILGHVHANNYVPLGFVEGYPCADVLELSYIRADIASCKASTSVFPQALDASNLPSRPDHLLWFYPYLPTPKETELSFEKSLIDANRSVMRISSTDLLNEIEATERRLQGLRRDLMNSMD